MENGTGSILQVGKRMRGGVTRLGLYDSQARDTRQDGRRIPAQGTLRCVAAIPECRRGALEARNTHRSLLQRLGQGSLKCFVIAGLLKHLHPRDTPIENVEHHSARRYPCSARHAKKANESCLSCQYRTCPVFRPSVFRPVPFSVPRIDFGSSLTSSMFDVCPPDTQRRRSDGPHRLSHRTEPCCPRFASQVVADKAQTTGQETLAVEIVKV
jgi:hypothetical protein